MSTYYSVLGVAEDASGRDITRAYKRRMFLEHPDRSKRADALQRAQFLNEAYGVLGDPARRAEYDSLVIQRASKNDGKSADNEYFSGPWGRRRPDFSEPEPYASKSTYTAASPSGAGTGYRKRSPVSEPIPSLAITEIILLFRNEITFWLVFIGVGVISFYLGYEPVAGVIAVSITISIVASKWEWLPFYSYFAVVSVFSTILLGLGCLVAIVMLGLTVLWAWFS